MIDLHTYNDVELSELLEAAKAEVGRRAVLADAENALRNLNQDVLNAKGVVLGAAWVQPTGAHDAYPQDWEVTLGGKTWVSLVNANVWKPGGSGWREKTASGEPAPFVQPTGAHDAYKKGDLVIWAGQVYRSKIDANVWSPSAHAAGWELQGPRATGGFALTVSPNDVDHATTFKAVVHGG